LVSLTNIRTAAFAATSTQLPLVPL
jgi:hypothetical protein